MENDKKLLGEERRTKLLALLKESNRPLTGSELAAMAKVSRQVIVGDMTLLKAKNEPIIATSQGYLYLNQASGIPVFEKTIACMHTPAQTEEELLLIVGAGATVKDVKIEHPVYGDLTASIMVSNKDDIRQFMKKIGETKASYLSQLTGGYHLHTITASTEQALAKAEEALQKAGFLIEME